jgi:hypothetical protein
MKYYGSTSTLKDVLRERRNDVATVESLQQYKATGRDMTGIRSVPTSESNVIAGDKVGDYLYDVAGGKLYRLIISNADTQWIEQTIVTTFTNP